MSPFLNLFRHKSYLVPRSRPRHMGRCSVRNQPTVTATRCLKVTKRRARACVVCTLFSPKVKPSKGKKKGKTKKRPNFGHPTSCTLTSRSHGHGQSERPRPRPRRRRSRRTCKIVRPLALGSVQSQDGPRTRTTHQQHEDGSLSVAQGFSDVACGRTDVKEGVLLRHHVT